DLHVANQTQVLLDDGRHVFLHHLHVVDVVQQKEIAGSDRLDKVERLRSAIQKEAGNVARIDRLDDELYARLFQARCGVSQVGQECSTSVLWIQARWCNARQTIHRLAAKGDGVFDRASDARLEFFSTPGEAGNTAFARVPVARRKIVQHLS